MSFAAIVPSILGSVATSAVFGGSKKSEAPAALPAAAPPAATTATAPPALSADVETRRQTGGRASLAGGVTDLENEVDSLGAPAGGARRRTASKTLLG